MSELGLTAKNSVPPNEWVDSRRCKNGGGTRFILAIFLTIVAALISREARATCPAQNRCTAPQIGEWLYYCTAPLGYVSCEPKPRTPYSSYAFSTKAAAESALRAQLASHCSVSLTVPAYVTQYVRFGLPYQESTGQFTYTSTSTPTNGPSCSNSHTHLVTFVRTRRIQCATGWIEDGSLNLCRIPISTANPQKDCNGCGVGNPIQPLLGNKHQVETDYVGPGPMPLTFARAYNGHPIAETGALPILSPPWGTSFERHIQFVQTSTMTTAFAFRGNGAVYAFNFTGGQFVADADVQDRLLVVTDSMGVQSGWQYVTSQDEIESYDMSGRLLLVQDRAGNSHTLQYNADGLLSTVTDSLGRQLSFTYEPGVYRLATMTVPGGGTYQYSYNSAGQVASVTYPDGTTRTYLYREAGLGSYAHLLTGIIDESNSRFATYKYDSSGRAISTEHGQGADKVSISFTGSTTRTVRTHLEQCVL